MYLACTFRIVYIIGTELSVRFQLKLWRFQASLKTPLERIIKKRQLAFSFGWPQKSCHVFCDYIIKMTLSYIPCLIWLLLQLCIQIWKTANSKNMRQEFQIFGKGTAVRTGVQAKNIRSISKLQGANDVVVRAGQRKECLGFRKKEKMEGFRV